MRRVRLVLLLQSRVTCTEYCKNTSEPLCLFLLLNLIFIYTNSFWDTLLCPPSWTNKQSIEANRQTSYPIKMIETGERSQALLYCYLDLNSGAMTATILKRKRSCRMSFYVATTETKFCPLLVSTIGQQIKATIESRTTKKKKRFLRGSVQKS